MCKYVCALFTFQELLQSISDHEPDYVSLKRNAHTLCEGPSDEPKLLTSMSQVRESSARFVAEKLDTNAKVQLHTSDKVLSASSGEPSSAARPGQDEMQSVLSEYDRRLEELKKKLKVCLSERESQLESAREFDGLLSEMMLWMGGADLEGLRVRDPSSTIIQNQQQKCQVLTHIAYYYMYTHMYLLNMCR